LANYLSKTPGPPGKFNLKVPFSGDLYKAYNCAKSIGIYTYFIQALIPTHTAEGK